MFGECNDDAIPYFWERSKEKINAQRDPFQEAEGSETRTVWHLRTRVQCRDIHHAQGQMRIT
jgi:hypothetical protein